MSKKPTVIPAKPKPADAPKSGLSYPLTLYRPPQFPGDKWQEEVYHTPAELAAMLAKIQAKHVAENE